MHETAAKLTAVEAKLEEHDGKLADLANRVAKNI